MKQYFVLGTYTEEILFGTGEVFHGKGKGISICEFENGSIQEISCIQTCNPSFLCINEKKNKIYAVNEAKEYKGKFGGGLTQISYAKDGTMDIEGEFAVGGMDPCHVAISPDGSFLSVANFASGSVTIFPLDREGNISGEGTLYPHQGHSVHPVRQKGPHAHSSIFAPDCVRMYVPDLGIDRIMAYDFIDGVLVNNETASLYVPAGSGPRFGEFDRSGRNFYLIHELSSQICHYAYENESMEERETVGTLPEGFCGENICADLHITPNGKWLYASNRGHDSLSCFALDRNGNMKLVAAYPSGGKTPRNFAIDPEGRYLLVGNQDSNQIVVFAIDGRGELNLTDRYDCGSPVCICFFKSFATNQ